MIIRDLGPGDLNAAWAINQANTPEVGDVGLDRFSWIADLASFNLVAEDGQDIVGFCMVLPPGTPYTSVNYRWFSERYETFAYLDRVAVDEAARGRGIGTALYAEAERRIGRGLFTLEVNLRPRNDVSLAFHERLGFREVGQQETDYGVLVSMLAKEL